MTSEFSPEDRKLRQTIAWPLTIANNYPKHVAARVLGADMTSIIDAVFNALKAEGYVKPKPPAFKPGDQVTITASGYRGLTGTVVREDPQERMWFVKVGLAPEGYAAERFYPNELTKSSI